MNNLIYAGVVIFGGVTLVIEARRNYSVSAKHHPFAYYGILKHLEAQHLCSPRDWNFGFYVYSLLYLITYAVLLSSTELIELIYTYNTSANLVGATDISENDPFSLSGTEYGKPLFISAFIIAFYSIGATRNIELHMRTLAHHLAGVPRGVYQVLDRLQDPDFLSKTKPRTGPLMSSFWDKVKNSPCENPIEELEIVSKFPLKQGGHLEKNHPEGKEKYLFDICKALRVIDLLHPSITGAQRATHFPLLGMKELRAISETLEKSIGISNNSTTNNDTAHKTLHELINAYDNYDEDNLIKLREKAIEVANSTRAVFAIYFICNSRRVLNVERHSALHKVQTFTDSGYKVEQNAFAGALFLSAVIATFMVFLIYADAKYKELAHSPERMASSIHEVLVSNPAKYKDLKYTDCEDIYKLTAKEVESKNTLSEDSLYQNCLDAMQGGKERYKSELTPLMKEWTFFDNLAMLLMVAAVVQMTIFEKEILIDQNAWRHWTFKRFPFINLFTSAIIPTILGVIALSIGYIIRLVYVANFDITMSQIEFLFVSHSLFFIAFLMPCFVLSISTFILIDRHHDWHLLKTLFFALIAVVLYAFSVWLFPAYNKIDSLIFSILPGLFLMLFALFLELSETPSPKNKGNYLKEYKK
ncbi:MAG: hypothetical protein V7782_07450 [Psychromonas sp.]